MGHDSHSVVFKVSKSVGSTGHHFHLVMEPFIGSIALVETPHGDNGLQPSGQRFSECPEWRPFEVIEHVPVLMKVPAGFRPALVLE